MLRRLIAAATVCLMAAVGPAHALGLGGIKVSSKLNQPFSAVIPFTSLSDAEAGNVRARLADNKAFARAGVDRSGYVGSLLVEVITEDGEPRIVISSKEIAREPLLSLMIEVSTPGGPRILREYTVFLDPPSSAPTPAPAAKSSAVPTAESEPQPVSRVAAPVSSKAAAPQSEFFQTAEETGSGDKPSPAAAATPSRYGPVRSGETLLVVARAVKPAGVGLEQAMLALYEANPTAFLNGDIDNLRKGATLKVPSAEQMKLLSNAAAGARVKELSAPIPATTPSVAAPVVPDSRSMTAAAEPAPVASAPAAPAPAPAAAQAAPAAPVAPAAETPADPASSSATATATAPAGVPAAEPAALAQPAAETTPQAAATTPATEVSPPPGPAPEAEAEAEPTDWVSKLLPVAIGLVGLLVLFAVVRAVRDRRAQREYEQASRETPATPVARSKSGAVATAKPARSALDELEELDRKLAKGDKVDEDATRVTPSLAPAVDDDRTRIEAATTGRFPRYTGGDPVATTPAREPDKAEQEVNSRFQATTTEIDLGDNDPMSEADFHLAYGLYDEAALMLQQASAKDPGRTELKVKLAETYFAAGKAREFEQTAAQLQGKLGADGWGKIAIMGQQLCPGSVLFRDASAPKDMTVDLAFGEEEAAIKPVVVDKGLEFNLDELELPTQVGATQPGAKADAGLEFDLGEFEVTGVAGQNKGAVIPDVDLKAFDLSGSTLSGPGKTDLDVRLDEIEPIVIDELSDNDTVVGHDEAGTKLDLARAYVEMGDSKMARSLLDEVEQTGTDEQKREAATLRERLLG